MGQVVVSGPDALPFLQLVMTADVAAFPVGSARYSLMCYDDGGVVDDTFIYRLPDRYFVAINATNSAKDTRWLRHHRHGYNVTVEDVSAATYMLALQGPLAAAILQPLCPLDLASLAFHTAAETTVAGVPTLLGRTGYTGEDGFELFFPTAQAPLVWDALMAAGTPQGMLPIGLAARDSLRFEAGMPLYGQEISALLDPLEAGLGWAVALDKGSFLGREALLKTKLEGTTQRLVGLRMTESGVPRHGYEVVMDGVICGVITSGMYSPTTDSFLALAYVPTAHSALGTTVSVLIRDKEKAAVVVKKPFYLPAYRR
jgi:aminomethyltransferase